MSRAESWAGSALKITTVVVMLCLAAAATYYFHIVAKTGIIYTHLFYIPIALAAFWWGWAAISVAVIFTIQLLLIHAFAGPIACSLIGDSICGIMFIVIGAILSYMHHKSIVAKRRLSEEINDREEKIRAGTEKLLIANKQLVSEIDASRKIEEITLKLSDLKEHLIGRIDIEDKLKMVTDEMVEVLDADFARIWMMREGDLCEKGCIHAAATDEAHICRDHSVCLHLVASSGRYTHIDGSHRRVPIGCYKIGRIASGMIDSFITNDVTHDARVHDHEWARSLGLVSFVGYRLTSADGSPVGVIAMFSRYAIPRYQHAMIEDLVNTVSQVLASATIERQIKERLKILEDLSVYSAEREQKIRDLEERLNKFEKGPTRRWDSPAA